jgi:hypothetical protein
MQEQARKEMYLPIRLFQRGKDRHLDGLFRLQLLHILKLLKLSLIQQAFPQEF